MTKGQHSQAPPDAAEAREIDAVLSLASVPPLPEGAAGRLMARIAAEPQENKVVALAPRREAPRMSPWRYAAALPLAASLVWMFAAPYTTAALAGNSRVRRAISSNSFMSQHSPVCARAARNSTGRSAGRNSAR